MESTTVQMAKRGVITIPQPSRESYGMQPGDTFALLDLGGIFVLSPIELDGLSMPQTEEMRALCCLSMMISLVATESPCAAWNYPIYAGFGQTPAITSSGQAPSRSYRFFG